MGHYAGNATLYAMRRNAASKSADINESRSNALGIVLGIACDRHPVAQIPQLWLGRHRIGGGRDRDGHPAPTQGRNSASGRGERHGSALETHGFRAITCPKIGHGRSGGEAPYSVVADSIRADKPVRGPGAGYFRIDSRTSLQRLRELRPDGLRVLFGRAGLHGEEMHYDLRSAWPGICYGTRR